MTWPFCSTRHTHTHCLINTSLLISSRKRMTIIVYCKQCIRNTCTHRIYTYKSGTKHRKKENKKHKSIKHKNRKQGLKYSAGVFPKLAHFCHSSMVSNTSPKTPLEKHARLMQWILLQLRYNFRHSTKTALQKHRRTWQSPGVCGRLWVRPPCANCATVSRTSGEEFRRSVPIASITYNPVSWQHWWVVYNATSHSSN